MTAGINQPKMGRTHSCDTDTGFYVLQWQSTVWARIGVAFLVRGTAPLWHLGPE